MSPRTVEAGNGWSWIADGFALFTKNPAMWVVLTLVLMVAVVVISFVPFLGSIAISVLWPVMVAGLLLGCKALEKGEELKFPHLIAGFEARDKLPQLVLVGVFYLIAMVVIVIIAFGAIGLPAISSMRSGASPDMGGMFAMMAKMFFGFLLAMGLSVPVAMALWFAPPLILFNNLSAVDAVKLSFSACLRNILPFLIFGLIGFGLSIIAAIPFGLGYLVLVPVMVCAQYCSHKDIFGDAASSAAAPSPTPPNDNPLLR
jgi:hypothetical protein